MALIRVPITGDKDIEYSNLDTHVAMSLQRYSHLNERITKAEEDLAKIEQQIKSSKIYLIGAIATVTAGIFTAVLAVSITLLKV
jgi:hypothetical protein